MDRTQVGYGRVSTADQNLDLQEDTLRAAGCEQIWTATASGATTARPGLDAALAACRAGDVLVVWKLDRLGRSLPYLVDTVHDLVARSIGFRSLHEQIDTTSGGKLIFHIFGPSLSLSAISSESGRTPALRRRGRAGGSYTDSVGILTALAK